MFKRIMMKSLLEWKDKPSRLPLILRGARQTGKTTLVNEFGKSFSTFIYLNLENIDDRKLISESFDETIMAIEFRISRKLTNDTLIFFDEIQACPEAITLLRFFPEKHPALAIVCAGSLLEVKLSHKTISFPTGRVEYLFLSPMSFKEFLDAKGKTLHAETISSTPLQLPLQIHQMIMKEYSFYLQTGGMPAAIRTFLENEDIFQVRNLHNNLFQSILDDIGRYLPKTDSKYIESVFDGAVYHTACRIKFENFNNSEFRSREVKHAFTMLQKAFLLYLSYPVTSTSLPQLPNSRKSPKLFFYDIGMMNSKIGTPFTFDISRIDCGTRGSTSEQFVFQELIASCIQIPEIPSFWCRESGNSNAEVDLCIVVNNLLIPIEIKSGPSGSLKSLGMFMNESAHQFAIRLYNAPPSIQYDVKTGVGKSFTLINLPLYYAGNLANAVREIVTHNM